MRLILLLFLLLPFGGLAQKPATATCVKIEWVPMAYKTVYDTVYTVISGREYPVYRKTTYPEGHYYLITLEGDYGILYRAVRFRNDPDMKQYKVGGVYSTAGFLDKYGN